MRSLALLAALFLVIAPNAHAGEFAAGKKVFNKCRGCHSIGPKVKKLPGPNLNGVVGRDWGTVEGYKYSKDKEGTMLAIHEAEARVWDVETLTAYLTKPKDVIPKGKMQFPGLKKELDIENIIFYLASFDADGAEADAEAVLAALAEAEAAE